MILSTGAVLLSLCKTQPLDGNNRWLGSPKAKTHLLPTIRQGLKKLRAKQPSLRENSKTPKEGDPKVARHDWKVSWRNAEREGADVEPHHLPLKLLLLHQVLSHADRSLHRQLPYFALPLKWKPEGEERTRYSLNGNKDLQHESSERQSENPLQIDDNNSDWQEHHAREKSYMFPPLLPHFLTRGPFFRRGGRGVYFEGPCSRNFIA